MNIFFIYSNSLQPLPQLILHAKVKRKRKSNVVVLISLKRNGSRDIKLLPIELLSVTKLMEKVEVKCSYLTSIFINY